MTRKLLSVFILAAALPLGAAVPHIEDLDAFGQTAAKAFDDVAHFNDKFILDWWRPGRMPNFAGIRCERSQEFHIVAMTVPNSDVGTDAAQFGIGACKAEAAKVREFAIGAQKQGKETLDKFMAGVKPEERAALEKMMVNRKVPLPGGATGYAFTMMLVGHGIMFMHGAVVDDPAKHAAYIVLADVSQLCVSRPDGKPFIETTLCPDTGKALLDLVTGLARRDAVK